MYIYTTITNTEGVYHMYYEHLVLSKRSWKSIGCEAQYQFLKATKIYIYMCNVCD